MIVGHSHKLFCDYFDGGIIGCNPYNFPGEADRNNHHSHRDKVGVLSVRDEPPAVNYSLDRKSRLTLLSQSSGYYHCCIVRAITATEFSTETVTSTQQQAQAQLTQQPRLEQGLDLLGLGSLLPELLNIPELGGLYPDLRDEEPRYDSLENIIGDTILDPSLIAALRDDPLFDATNSIKQPVQDNPQPREKVILFRLDTLQQNVL